MLTFGTVYQAKNSKGYRVEEFEPFVRCIDALGVDAAQNMNLNDSSLLCPKNMKKAIPASLEGQQNVMPDAPIIVMTSCQQAAYNRWVPDDPDYCFNGKKTREMSDEDFLYLSDLQQYSNEIYAEIFLLQQKLVLSHNDTTISWQA